MLSLQHSYDLEFLLLLQVRQGFKEVVKRMEPSAYAIVLTEYSVYSNGEGEFGDAEIMGQTSQDSANQMPVWQWWSQQCKPTLCALQGCQTSRL